MSRDPLKEPKFGDVFVHSSEPRRPVMYVSAEPQGWLGVDLAQPQRSLLGEHPDFYTPTTTDNEYGKWSIVEAAP